MTRGGRAEGCIGLDTRRIILELRQFLSPEKPVSLRFCLYQLVSRGVLESTAKPQYTKLMRALLTARIRGSDSEWGLDDDCIVDTRRRVEQIQTWKDLSEFKEWASDVYRRDHWATQRVQVECWLEKFTAAFLVEEVAERWCIPLRVSTGSFSGSFLVRAADDINARLPKQTLIRYAGDFDPKGLDIERAAREGNGKSGARRREGLLDILESRHNWTADEIVKTISWERIALTEQDFDEIPAQYKIDVKDMPRRDSDSDEPADKTVTGYVAKYGASCSELEALDVWKPGEVARRLDREIRGSLDRKQWNKSLATEEDELDELTA